MAFIGQYYYFISFILTFNFATVFSYTTTRNQIGNSIFVYPGQSRSERDLHICPKNAICSIIHKRFWFPQQIERFCRCEEVNDYSSKWSDDLFDNYTMPLDNRSQLKFCDTVGTLPNCLKNRNTLSVEYQIEGDNVKITSNATCYCPPHTTWKLHQHLYNDFQNGTVLSTYLYRCSELEKCAINEYCGDVRTDHFSTYYRCSCPQGQLCIHTSNELYNTSRPFFEGQSYKAQCTSTPILQSNPNVIQQQ